MTNLPGTTCLYLSICYLQACFMYSILTSTSFNVCAIWTPPLSDCQHQEVLVTAGAHCTLAPTEGGPSHGAQQKHTWDSRGLGVPSTARVTLKCHKCLNEKQMITCGDAIWPCACQVLCSLSVYHVENICMDIT